MKQKFSLRNSGCPLKGPQSQLTWQCPVIIFISYDPVQQLPSIVTNGVKLFISFKSYSILHNFAQPFMFLGIQRHENIVSGWSCDSQKQVFHKFTPKFDYQGPKLYCLHPKWGSNWHVAVFWILLNLNIFFFFCDNEGVRAMSYLHMKKALMLQ